MIWAFVIGMIVGIIIFVIGYGLGTSATTVNQNFESPEYYGDRETI